MSTGKANCTICQASIVYSEKASGQVCHLCGHSDIAHCVCESGHYVCDKCHRLAGVDYILDVCKTSKSTNPALLAIEIMSDKSIYPNGPEHHTLVGAVLFACYKNAGGNINLDAVLSELEQRSLQVPGGTCGYWGVCGAAISAGQFYSIVSGSTPMTTKPWANAARLTSRILSTLADIGGPRCCKRAVFTSIVESVCFIKDAEGVSMDVPAKIVCTFMSDNSECKKRDCPYYS